MTDNCPRATSIIESNAGPFGCGPGLNWWPFRSNLKLLTDDKRQEAAGGHQALGQLLLILFERISEDTDYLFSMSSMQIKCAPRIYGRTVAGAVARATI